jgi:hypothetical protein
MKVMHLPFETMLSQTTLVVTTFTTSFASDQSHQNKWKKFLGVCDTLRSQVNDCLFQEVRDVTGK